MNFAAVKIGSSYCSCPLENPKCSQLFTQFLVMAAIHKQANALTPCMPWDPMKEKAKQGREETESTGELLLCEAQRNEGKLGENNSGTCIRILTNCETKIKCLFVVLMAMKTNRKSNYPG